ncbi:MAG: bifunctional D-glycero-beta-D-manno-heptose-7-phosphate kinase/D-glycero-beta-D-manno-heptose 1-phosphate adenylyltransferase HldE [bacterium]
MVIDLNKKEFEEVRILVVGDIMLDRYIWGNVNRISPEAPVPVFHLKKESEMCGGAGNVISNLIGLGCLVTVIGVCGDDETGRHLSYLLNNDKIKNLIMKDSKRPTVTKSRIVANGQQLLRIDEEDILPLNSNLQKRLLDLVKDELIQCNAIILSDYGKGVLQTPGLSQSIISLGRCHNIPVMVDPKGNDWIRYRGATCVTPNTLELETVWGDSISDENKLIVAMRKILRDNNLSWLLVTRGPLGMCLMNKDNEPIFIPTVAKEVYDVSGAGDTVIATLSLGVAAGYSFPEAAYLANMAAGIVVGRIGTHPINILELEASIAINEANESGNLINKVTSLSAAEIQLHAWRAAEDKIVFTNGCFDLLHPGHIHLLKQAKDLGDRLIVGLNSDDSIKRLKGSKRPILNENDRASILSSLSFVDLIIIFEDDTPLKLIKALKPDILVKGTDYSLNEVVGREIVESYGGEVSLINLLQGYSTTDITKKVLCAHSTAFNCVESTL